MCYEPTKTGHSARRTAWALRLILLLVVVAAITRDALSSPLPVNAVKYLPMLIEVRADVGPVAASLPGWEAAQVQKETCITVKHSKCWNPYAELKTDREYGFGMGQITIKYRADGSEVFNVFKEVQRLDPVLRGWKWENRFDPRMQFRALLIKNKIGYSTITGAKSDVDHLAFSLAGYNGGLGGLLSDRAICQATRGCDPGRWFGNVENTSNKSRTPWKGYGKSAFDINREYPRDIIYILRPQYEQYFKGK